MSALHLYEFDGSGFHIAESKEEAFALVMDPGGLDLEEVEDDFKREVPADEFVLVTSFEEPWDHTRQVTRELPHRVYHTLSLTAQEWIEFYDRRKGYCFGGDE
jgi:hypothetical protein